MADFSLHRDFWYFNKKEDKRYCLIFSNWTDVLLSYSISFFNSEDEIKEETVMLNNMYCSTPKPYKTNVGSKYNKKYEICFDDNAFYWGYVIFDFQEETYSCHHDGIVVPLTKPRFNYKKYASDCVRVNNKSDKLITKDYFLRKPNEIDPDYKFKQGEYEGWLQFRWGDGKNAIGYVEEPKKERPGHDEYIKVWDNSKEIYIRKKVRVVDVPWDDPLPKKEKGIYYRRPNKEPVKFPGDFGYEDDYSIWPWSLSEEIAEEEYIDNGNTLDKKETLFSIGDMIQEDIDKQIDKEKSKYLMDKYGW